MTPRIQKKLRQARWHEQMHVTHRHAAGVDVHPHVHWVAVAPGDAPPASADQFQATGSIVVTSPSNGAGTRCDCRASGA
jgi:hypothetical protein